MPYVGRSTDKISNVEVLDNITFDGSSSYTLQKNSVNFTPSSANTLLVSIDGVVQAGNFTVSGSTIDFGTAVAGTSTCDFILHYGIGLITTPADNTVTTAKLGDSAVTTAKLGDSAVTTAKLGDSAVTTAKLNDASVSLAKLTATGTKDATTFLRGDNTFAAVSGSSDAFLARGMSGHASGTLIFNSEVYDDGGNYNVANGKYVAPSNGYYIFTTSMIPATASGRQIVFKVNNSFVYGGLDGMTYSDSTSIAATVTMILSLSASDEVTVFVDATVYSNYIYFSGGKLY